MINMEKLGDAQAKRLGERIRATRIAQGMSQAALASKASIFPELVISNSGKS